MHGFHGDLRFAIRQFRSNPGFTLAAVLALGLGIGGASAMFSVIEGVLLRPLPYHEADRLVVMWEKADRLQLDVMWVSVPNFYDWSQRNRSFESLGAFAVAEAGLSGAGEPERIQAATVTEGLFSVLRLRPAIGRWFRPEEEVSGGPRAIVLTDGLWRRRFGADSDVLGREIRLNGESYTVVGVAPRDFRFPEITDRPPEVLVSFSAFVTDDPDVLRRTNHPGLTALGRLRPGVGVTEARADMQAVAAALREQYPENFDDGVTLRTLKEAIVGESRAPLLILFSAVGLLLLIACANVAGLLLARGAWRERELSLRAALGAGPGRLMRQLLAESILLALLGGAAGLLIASWAVDALVAINPGSLPRADEVGVDLPVLLVALTIAILTGVLAGIAPALLVRRSNLADALKDGTGRSTFGMARQRLRRSLVTAELALAIVLLAGAGLLLRSFAQVVRTDPGFEPRGVLFMDLTLPSGTYGTPERHLAFFEGVIERLGSVPGVIEAAVVSDAPLSGSGRQSGLRVEGEAARRPGELPPLADIEIVSPEYFRTLGISLLRGRGFERGDVATGPLVTVVDQALASRIFPATDPVGRRIAVDSDQQGRPIWREIVGVVETTRHYGLDVVGRVLMYVPAAQSPEPTMTLAVRISGNPSGLVPVIRAELARLDPELAPGEARVLADLIASSVAPRRLHAVLLSVFAGTALVLASLGTYGVVSYSVARRTREIGIRVALGAGRWTVLALLTREGLALALAAAAVGVPAALALTQVLRGQLYGVSPADPATLLTIVAVLAGVASLASYLPARRAARVDPMAALRSE